MRGDVHRLTLPRTRGHEQAGPRYAVVLQLDALGALSTVLVAPTSTSAPARSWRPAVQVAGRETLVLVEQATAVDTRRLGELVGHLSYDDITAVDQALRLVLDL